MATQSTDSMAETLLHIVYSNDCHRLQEDTQMRGAADSISIRKPKSSRKKKLPIHSHEQHDYGKGYCWNKQRYWYDSTWSNASTSSLASLLLSLYGAPALEADQPLHRLLLRLPQQIGTGTMMWCMGFSVERTCCGRRKLWCSSRVWTYHALKSSCTIEQRLKWEEALWGVCIVDLVVLGACCSVRHSMTLKRRLCRVGNWVEIDLLGKHGFGVEYPYIATC